jgi:hypothetical protein
MTITVELRTLGGNPTAANTLVGSQSIAAPSTWTRMTGLGTVTRGGRILAYSDAEPFRILVVDPVESTNTSGPIPDPRSNGVLVPWFGAGAQLFEDRVGPNEQVWVKAA